MKFFYFILLLWIGIGMGNAAETDSTELSALNDAELDALEAALIEAEDIEAIKRLTHIFGYYRDRFMQEEMLALFSEDAVVDFAGGRYLGKSSIRRLFGSDVYKPASIVGSTGPQDGVLNDHILMQHVITLGDDGQTANGRFKDWNMQAEAGVSASISTGTYENQYVKENGVWKISSMAYCTRYERPYYSGMRELQENPRSFRVPTFYPEDPDGPDKQSNIACHVYPDVGINPPFHYPHAVTGEVIQKP